MSNHGPRIIGICGPAGSGKSTLARMLQNHGYNRVGFADSLKDMLGTIIPRRHLWGTVEEKEEKLDYLFGLTGRHLMQTLGTEWGRSMHPAFWLAVWKARTVGKFYELKAMRPKDDPLWGFVVDDIRFPNEAEFLRSLGGIIIRRTRQGARTGNDGHASEQQHKHIREDIAIADLPLSELKKAAQHFHEIAYEKIQAGRDATVNQTDGTGEASRGTGTVAKLVFSSAHDRAASEPAAIGAYLPVLKARTAEATTEQESRAASDLVTHGEDT